MSWTAHPEDARWASICSRAISSGLAGVMVGYRKVPAWAMIVDHPHGWDQEKAKPCLNRALIKCLALCLAPAPLWRCNLLMRAVPVAAGTHTIRLRYSPPGLVAAAIVSAIASLLLLALAVLLRRRSTIVGAIAREPPSIDLDARMESARRVW
jgi:hypothetical protein